MCMLAMHISLVNLRRQIQVWDLHREISAASHKEAVPAFLLWLKQPALPQGVSSDSSLPSAVSPKTVLLKDVSCILLGERTIGRKGTSEGS